MGVAVEQVRQARQGAVGGVPENRKMRLRERARSIDQCSLSVSHVVFIGARPHVKGKEMQVPSRAHAQGRAADNKQRLTYLHTYIHTYIHTASAACIMLGFGAALQPSGAHLLCSGRREGKGS